MWTWNACVKYVSEVSRGAAARSVTVKPNGCWFDPHSRRWNIYINLYFHFFALVSRLSAALSSATQHCLQNSAESGEWNVLTLSSLCLPCCVRDTAWSWLNIYLLDIAIRDLWNQKLNISCLADGRWLFGTLSASGES